MIRWRGDPGLRGFSLWKNTFENLYNFTIKLWSAEQKSGMISGAIGKEGSVLSDDTASPGASEMDCFHRHSSLTGASLVCIHQVEVRFTGAMTMGPLRFYNPDDLLALQISVMNWFYQFKFLTKRGKGGGTPRGTITTPVLPGGTAKSSISNQLKSNFSLWPVLLLPSSCRWCSSISSCIESLPQSFSL